MVIFRDACPEVEKALRVTYKCVTLPPGNCRYSTIHLSSDISNTPLEYHFIIIIFRRLFFEPMYCCRETTVVKPEYSVWLHRFRYRYTMQQRSFPRNTGDELRTQASGVWTREQCDDAMQHDGSVKPNVRAHLVIQHDLSRKPPQFHINGGCDGIRTMKSICPVQYAY